MVAAQIGEVCQNGQHVASRPLSSGPDEGSRLLGSPSDPASLQQPEGQLSVSVFIEIQKVQMVKYMIGAKEVIKCDVNT